MSRFTNDLVVRFDSSGQAVVVEPLIWELDGIGSGRFVVVPAGFTSDGATVPRPFWALLPPFDPKVIRAPVLHDYMTTYPGPGERRSYADKQFRLALRALGVNSPTAWILWSAVRAFSAVIDVMRSPLWKRRSDGTQK